MHQKWSTFTTDQCSLGQCEGMVVSAQCINGLEPYSIFFSYNVFRIRLAAIHYNHNADRDSDLTRQLTITHPKHKKGEATVKAMSSKADYSTFTLVCKHVIGRATRLLLYAFQLRMLAC